MRWRSWNLQRIEGLARRLYPLLHGCGCEIRVELTQRALVNRRVHFSDKELTTKYVFPFWDGQWKVVLTLLDRFGAPPAIVFKPTRLEGKDHVSISAGEGDLEPLERWKPETFRTLYHYDPWWVFRGIGGVPDAIKEAILPTNIAKEFSHGKQRWKVHDVIFDSTGQLLEAIVAKNHVFHQREFTGKDLDLAATWPKATTRRR